MHLQKHAQIWDVGCQRQVEIKGKDALKLIELMTPRSISELQPGKCLYIPLTDENGGIINDPILIKISADHFYLSVADSDVLLWARGLAIGFGLNVRIRNLTCGLWQYKDQKLPMFWPKFLVSRYIQLKNLISTIFHLMALLN